MSKQHSDALVFVTVQKRGLKSVLKFNEVEAAKANHPPRIDAAAAVRSFFSVWVQDMVGELYIWKENCFCIENILIGKR